MTELFLIAGQLLAAEHSQRQAQLLSKLHQPRFIAFQVDARQRGDRLQIDPLCLQGLVE
ncbi:hypothetical protein D3C86_2170840 [compost metagenome]